MFFIRVGVVLLLASSTSCFAAAEETSSNLSGDNSASSKKTQELSRYIGSWIQIPAPSNRSNPWLQIESSKEKLLIITKRWTGYLATGGDADGGGEDAEERAEHETQLRGRYEKKIELGGDEKYVLTESGNYSSYFMGKDLFIVDYREDKNFKRGEKKPDYFGWVKSLKRLSLSEDGKTLTLATLVLDRYPHPPSKIPQDFDESGNKITYQKQN